MFAAIALPLAFFACGGDSSGDLREAAEFRDDSAASLTGDVDAKTAAPNTSPAKPFREESVLPYAGTNSPRYTGDGGPAVQAGLFAPQGLALDKDGNLFLSTDKRIRRVEAATGIITTVAGSGSSLSIEDGGPALKAGFREPRGLAVDSNGNLFIADHGTFRVRRVEAATGIVTTIAGGAVPRKAIVMDIGDGGPADQSYVHEPSDVAVDLQGNLYIVSNHRIRKVDGSSGIISTVTGNGQRNLTGDGGPAVKATVAEPEAVAVDSSGNIYIADADNHRVRKIEAATGLISTLAGVGVFQDRSAGNMINDYRREGTGAGYSGDGGPAAEAKLRLPNSLDLDTNGDLYIVDAGVRVRKVDAFTGIISTYFGAEAVTTKGEQGKLAVRTGVVGRITSIAVNKRGDVFLADSLNNRVHLIPSPTR